VASFGLVQQSFLHTAGPDLAEPCRLADRLEKDIQQWSHVGVPANRLERLGGPVHVSLLLAPAENKSHWRWLAESAPRWKHSRREPSCLLRDHSAESPPFQRRCVQRIPLANWSPWILQLVWGLQDWLRDGKKLETLCQTLGPGGSSDANFPEDTLDPRDLCWGCVCSHGMSSRCQCPLLPDPKDVKSEEGLRKVLITIQTIVRKIISKKRK
jgi:hypothetical protein